MRRLWPVLGVCVLAGACGRPNPGFALLDSGDPAGSDGQSGSGGSTGTSSVSSAPTSTEASTATTGVVTGSEGTTDPVDPTSTTASGSTDATGGTTMVAGHWEFPTDCGAAYLESEFTDAATDTFFLNEVPDTECSFLMGLPIDPNCQDLEFSLSDKFQLFLQSDLNNNKLEDYVGIYAVRFATPTPLHDGQIPIPEAAFLGVEARIHLFRPFPKNPWAPLKFYVRRFTDGDEWMTKEGFDFTPCHAPATSYRCRVCTVEAMVHKPCMVEWGGQEAKHKGVPYDPAVPPIQMLNVQVEPDPENGNPLLLNVFTKEDLAWLTTEGVDADAGHGHPA